MELNRLNEINEFSIKGNKLAEFESYQIQDKFKKDIFFAKRMPHVPNENIEYLLDEDKTFANPFLRIIFRYETQVIKSFVIKDSLSKTLAEIVLTPGVGCEIFQSDGLKLAQVGGYDGFWKRLFAKTHPIHLNTLEQIGSVKPLSFFNADTVIDLSKDTEKKFDRRIAMVLGVILHSIHLPVSRETA